MISNLPTAHAGPRDVPHAAHWCAALLRGEEPGRGSERVGSGSGDQIDDHLRAVRAKLDPALLANQDYALVPDPLIALGRLLLRGPSFALKDAGGTLRPRLILHKLRRLANELDQIERDLSNLTDVVTYGRVVRGAAAIAARGQEVRAEARRLEDASYLVNTPYWVRARVIRPIAWLALATLVYPPLTDATYAAILADETGRVVLFGAAAWADVALIARLAAPLITQASGSVFRFGRYLYQTNFDPDRASAHRMFGRHGAEDVVANHEGAVRYATSTFYVRKLAAVRMIRDAPAQLTTAAPEATPTEFVEPMSLSEVRVDEVLYNDGTEPVMLEFVRIRRLPAGPRREPPNGTPGRTRRARVGATPNAVGY